MDTKKPSISWFGIALVIVGAALLLIRLHVLDIKFSTIFWGVVSVFGLVAVTRGFSSNYRWKIFWGTLMFLFGVFFSLGSAGLIENHGHMFPSAFFLIFGIAFLMMYFNDVHEWLFLVPGLMFAGVGTLLILAEFEYLTHSDIFEAIHLYWPVVLIVVGVAFIFRRKNSRRSEQVASQPAVPE